MGLAERCLDPSESPRLEALTATPPEEEGASPGAGGYWAEAFQRLVATLRLRAAMREELWASTPGVPPNLRTRGGAPRAPLPAGCAGRLRTVRGWSRSSPRP